MHTSYKITREIQMDIKSALIVDDSKIARITLKKQLESRGIAVSVTESGEQAIDFLSTGNPDIIFMDCLMSGIDGFETTRQIHSRPNLSAPPIVMCTGKKSDEDKQKAFNLGAVGYMCKSSSPEPLNTLLDELSNTKTRVHAPANSPELEINSPELEINRPELEIMNSPEPGSRNKAMPVTKNTRLYDINQITQIAEQSASKIAEQISHKIAARVAAAVGIDKRLAASNAR